MELIKHDGKNFKEGKCPHCNEEDISEITGWCYNHHNPTFDGDRRFCNKEDECGFISQIKEAYICNNCDTLYDKDSMTNWNLDDEWFVNCPIGEEIPERINEDQDPEEYTEGLLELMSEFSEDRLNECLKEGYIIEAVVILQRRIAEQIRIILIRKIRKEQMLKPSKVDDRYKRIVPFLKQLKDFDLNEMAFIHDVINKDQLGKINTLNNLRNKISHALNFPEISKYSDRQKQMIISEARNISQLLDKVVFGQQ